MNTVPLTTSNVQPGIKIFGKHNQQPARILAFVSPNGWRISWDDDGAIVEWNEEHLLKCFDRLVSDDEAPDTKPSSTLAKAVSKDEDEKRRQMKFFASSGPNTCSKCGAPFPCSYHP